MRVLRFSRFDDLPGRADAWNRLAAGQPMRGWDWQSLWWQHYRDRCRGGELYLAAVLDGEDLVAVAPWYRTACPWRGRMLRFLGGYEVCSDYLGVLCDEAHRGPALAALSDWLAQQGSSGGPDAWDQLDLDSFDAQDQPTLELIDQMARLGHLVDRRAGPNCWRLTLPESWEAYLAGLSKSRRKQVRRMENRWLAPGRAVLRTAADAGQLQQGLEILADLHRRRRGMWGEPGRFAAADFAAFHCDVAPRLLSRGQVALHWLELDGRPVAAEYHLAGNGITYAYQSGVEPAALEHEPGSLITVAVLRRAIQQGGRAFDFLRGDEPYKGYWRAQPRGSLRVSVAARRTPARLRFRAWHGLRRLRAWVRGLIPDAEPASPAEESLHSA